MREARVQGQLEHPAVVPVYDLGVDPEGNIYFTMKRIRGVTLEEIIQGLRRAPREYEKRWSRRRLLTAFSQVCLAVDFAHQRGVLHRDLKPANVMLGDYGEVYVLDWGIAKVQGSPDMPVRASVDIELPGPRADTLPGAVLGTPGYLAPEQLRGEPGRMGPWSDVYSLGAVLFELLTLVELHGRTSLAHLAASTLAGADARPSVRAPDRDVPPELEEILVEATALDPADRYQSARELNEAVERYLDGERDEERRRELSAEHAESASSYAARARASSGPSALEERRHAMREVGRALALDPENELAMRTMVELLSDPPRHTPPEVEHELAESQFAQTRWLGRVGGLAYVGLFAYLPFFAWVGVRQWEGVALFYTFAVLTGVASLAAALKRRPPVGLVLAVLVLSNATFAAASAFFGPWLVTPALVAINTAAFSLHLSKSHRLLSMAVGVAAVAVPVALDLLGLLPASQVFTDAGMLITPGSLSFPRIPMTVFLTVISIGTVLTGAISVTRVRDVLNETEHRLHVHNWHMRELLAPERRR